MGRNFNLLREAIEPFENENQKIIINTYGWDYFFVALNFVEKKNPFLKEKFIKIKMILMNYSDDVMSTNTVEIIVQRFKRLDVRILLGAERTVWPDICSRYIQTIRVIFRNWNLNAGILMGISAFFFSFVIWIE